MKQFNDTTTPDMHENGAPAFDLEISHESPWPMPAAKPWAPAPRDTKQLQEWGQRLERWAQRRMKA